MSNKNNFSHKKTAIVHDFLTCHGGAENVLEEMGEILPQAPLYTLIYDKELAAQAGKGLDWLKEKRVGESFLGKFPGFLKKRKRLLLPFAPTAVESLDLRDYEWIISSSGAFSKGIVTKSHTKHICYMHSPMRYLWDWSYEYLQDCKLANKSKFLTRLFLNYLRIWDRASAQRPDYLIANSQYTADRIYKYYRRKAEVIYPPVKMDDIQIGKFNRDYFLTVARLSEYKRLDILIDAFDKLNLPLIIVGDGAQKKKLLKKIKRECFHPENIKIVGWLERKQLIKMYQEARAFVFAAEEDFGIAPVEAMAAGKPVIAYGKGGVLETVIEGKTGEFFNYPQVEIVADAVCRFIEKEKKYKQEVIRRQAEKFSQPVFQENFINYLKRIK
ncbi:MAG: glycosyltransferase [Patescibacteria group bacterium]